MDTSIDLQMPKCMFPGKSNRPNKCNNTSHTSTSECSSDGVFQDSLAHGILLPPTLNESLTHSYSTCGGTTTINGGNITDMNTTSMLHHHHHEGQPFSFDLSSCLVAEPFNLPPPPPPPPHNNNNNNKEDDTHLWVPMHDNSSLLNNNNNNNVFTTMWPTDDDDDDQMGAYLGGIFGTSTTTTTTTTSIGLDNDNNNNNINMSTAPPPKQKRGPKPKYLYKSAEEAAEARKHRNRKAALDSYYKKRNTIQELQDEIARLQRENDLLKSVMADGGGDGGVGMDVCEDDCDGQVFVNEAQLDTWIASKLKE